MTVNDIVKLNLRVKTLGLKFNLTVIGYKHSVSTSITADNTLITADNSIITSDRL